MKLFVSKAAWLLFGISCCLLICGNGVGGELEERSSVVRTPGRARVVSNWVWKDVVGGTPVEIVLEFEGKNTPLVLLENGKSVDYGVAVAHQIEQRIDADSTLLKVVIKGKAGGEFTLKNFDVKATPRVADTHRQFVASSPNHGRLDFSSFIWDLALNSSANLNIPFIQGYSREGNNSFLMGFIDQVRDTRIGHHATHQGSGDRINKTEYTLKRPTGPWGAVTGREYTESIFISTSKKPRHEVFADYVTQVDRLTKPIFANVPAASLEPLWCSWYAYRSDIDEQKMLANAREAKKLGIGTLLIDAGWWQVEESDDPTFPMGKIVEKPERFSDLKGFVDKIHAMGMKVIVWTAPFYWSGKNEKTLLDRYKGIKNDGSYHKYLCPRMPGVAEIEAAVIADVVEKYNLDGVKIDFIDVGPTACVSKNHEHDVPMHGIGTDRALRAISAAVLKVNPEAILEYRTNYANLNSRQYANCFRANDSPYDYDMIRKTIAELRQWSGPIPTHADYAYWPSDEKWENKARFLASISYGCVPTFSLDLVNLPDRDKRLVASWIKFFKKHRQSLLFGEFVPLSFDSHYSVSKIRGEKDVFFGLFAEMMPGRLDVSSEQGKAIYLINGSNETRMRTTLDGIEGRFEVTVVDAVGEDVGQKRVYDVKGELGLQLDVPVGGVVRVARVAK